MNEIIYRPQHKSEDELKDDFVIRLLEFEKLMNSIKGDELGKTPQHIILQGQRGMGKTTLMYRVYYQVLKDYRKEGLVPVIFSEEQYSIRTLYKLWEQIARFLEDHEPEYRSIWYEMQEIQGNDDDYEERCFDLLQKSIIQHGHRLLLLIDNFGVMIDKFTKREQQRLREILITFPFIKIIGGSAVILESFFAYDKPFFDFFKIVKLSPLNSEEVTTLLTRLAKKHESKHIQDIIETQPGRIESMRILTGGVPRTIVMLFNIFLDSDRGNSIEDLKKLIEAVTPLYKHRMDELPPQQQEIIDKLALNWDGMSVAELTQKTRMESKALSSQLNNLEKSGIVVSEKSTGRNKFYQMEERFFNIWYLMHHAPRSGRQKVIWLTRFLEFWCPSDLLEHTASGFAKRLREEKMHPEYIIAMTHAYSGAHGLSLQMREQIIEAASSALLSESETTYNLPLAYSSVLKEVIRLVAEKQFNKAQALVDKASLPEFYSSWLLGHILGHAGKMSSAEDYYLKAWEKGNVNAMYDLAWLYYDTKNYQKAEEYYLMAVERKHAKAMNNLAILYEEQYKDYQKAEQYYLIGVEQGDSDAIYNLAMFYELRYKDYQKAETYYLMAMEKGDFEAYNNMVNLVIKTDMQKHATMAESWVDKLVGAISNKRSKAMRVRYYLWVNKPELATSFLEQLLPAIEKNEDSDFFLSDVLAFAIAKGLRQYVLKLFQQEEYQLKDRFKVLYYALMTLLQDEYPNEVKRMGKELEEPVAAMVKYIKEMEEKYR